MNFREQFNSRVASFIAQHINDRQTRIDAVRRLIDEYVETHGERPPAYSLNLLSEYLLYEELKDRAKNKVSATEYPFLSEHQFERRTVREYSLTLADDYDADGVNRKKPIRRRRTAKEIYYVDKTSRMKNRRRKAAYKRDTSPGRIVEYNLRDIDGQFTEAFVSAVSQAKRWRDVLSNVYVEKF